MDKAMVQAWAEQQTCPACGHEGMRIEWRLKARPLGSFSLAGSQMKVSATETPYLICDGCDIEAEGER